MRVVKRNLRQPGMALLPRGTFGELKLPEPKIRRKDVKRTRQGLLVDTRLRYPHQVFGVGGALLVMLTVEQNFVSLVFFLIVV